MPNKVKPVVPHMTKERRPPTHTTVHCSCYEAVLHQLKLALKTKRISLQKSLQKLCANIYAYILYAFFLSLSLSGCNITLFATVIYVYSM